MSGDDPTWVEAAADDPTLRDVAAALAGDVPALRRMGVTFPVPRWRRWVQARVASKRYRLWAQRQAIKAAEDG